MIKITKNGLLHVIEQIISDGVSNMEEVDITASKVVDKIWPLIDYLKQNQSEDNKH